MGGSVRALCTCGFETSYIWTGGGMEHLNEYYAFPAYCQDGNHIITVNIYESRFTCLQHENSEPIPFSSEKLSKEQGRIFSWVLVKVGYFRMANISVLDAKNLR